MVAPENSPELTVVSESETAGQEDSVSSGASKASGGQSSAGRRWRASWLWAVLGGVVLVLGLQQYQRAETLTARVEALTQSLAEADRQLGAYKTRLTNVRARVSDLDDRMGALRALLDTDPLQPAVPVETSEAPAP